MVKRCVVLGVPILAAGVIAFMGAPASATIPNGVHLEVITPNAVVSGVDASLLDAGSIKGALSALPGGVLSAEVVAYSNGQQVGSDFSTGGTYEIDGLLTGSYDVCVPPLSIFGGNSTTGYLGRCYPNVPFNGTSVPAAATEVAVNAGTPTSGINLTIPSAAAISGKIMNSGGTGIGEVDLVAKNRASGQLFHTFTASNGSFKIEGLTPSGPGYSLCGDPHFSIDGPTGYLPHCFKNVAWNGGTIPSGATALSVSAGHTHANVDITLPPGAAISGRATDAGNGQPIASGLIGVFSPTGRELGFAITDGQGNYKVKGLGASTGNRVCDFPTTVGPTTSYRAECWKNIAWNGDVHALPNGTTSVSTTIGHTHPNIDFTVAKVTIHLGSIAGTITDAAGGGAIQNAQVLLFGNNGLQIDSTPTNASGGYQFTQLKPNATGYRVCARAIDGTVEQPTTPPGGWAPFCWSGVSWNGVPPPGAATKIPISPGQNKIGVDIALPRGGGVSGTLFKSDGTTPAAGVFVAVFTPSGGLLGSATSGPAGTYTIIDLRPSMTGYPVCFDGRQAGSGTAGYLPECYDNVAWDGNP
jgi:Carboxypeptidase regulatory-like domain